MLRADDLTIFVCRMSRNSGILNLLKPQGPVQACTGTALPLFYLFTAQHIIMPRTHKVVGASGDINAWIRRKLLLYVLTNRLPYILTASYTFYLRHYPEHGGSKFSKGWCLPTRLHGVIPRKTVVFILSNLIQTPSSALYYLANMIFNPMLNKTSWQREIRCMLLKQKPR